MNRRWLLRRTNAEYVSYLSRESSVSPALAQILINRGLKTPGEIHSFLNQSVESLSDPFAIAGMERAVEAVREAMRAGTKIFVHGDYDADGLTSASMLVSALGKLGLDVRYFIPNRFRDGYGFNPPAVERALEAGAGLIITVDCGISSFEAAEKAEGSGIGLIVTDHHEPVMDQATGRPRLPTAISVINPKLTNPELAGLSGSAVTLKLIQALAAIHPGRLSHREYMDLAALGVVADSVPLLGENRLIAREGLRLMQEGGRHSIKALAEVSGLNGRQLSAELLSFTLVPRINAAGRIADAAEVVELLLSDSPEEAARIAGELDRNNAERQRIEEGVLTEALGQLEKKGVGSAIVLAGKGWHEGVIGIVAAKIADRFSRPAFVLSIDGDVARGSARSIPQFDVHGGLCRVSDLLISFGGHPQAAGLRLRVSDMEAFEKRISGIVEAEVEDFTPSLTIDAHIGLREVKFKLVEELRMLEPFGYGNPQPVLGTRNLEVLSPRVVGRNHLKMRLKSRSKTVDAIGFNMGELCPVLEGSPKVDVAYAATINEWEGNRTLQLNLKGIRPLEA